MSTIYQAFGYDFLIVPIVATAIDFAQLDLPPVGTTGFISNAAPYATNDIITESGSGLGYRLEAGTATRTISNAALTSNVVTITTSAAHGFVAGDEVTISGGTGAAATLNGTYVVATAPTTTTFTFPLTATNITSASATGSVRGPSHTQVLLDGTVTKPFKLFGLTDSSEQTSTSEEETITYDVETQGVSLPAATSKSGEMSLAGVSRLKDAGYKVMRILEQRAVSESTMCKFARIGPTGSTETIYGYGRFTNYQTQNTAGTTVKWTATLKFYGPYRLKLDNAA